MSDEAKIVSIVGGCRRQNRWRVAEDTSVMTLFGRCYLDLREAECDADLIEISVLNVFANITIIVPEGCDVRPSGMALLGSSSCLVPISDNKSPLPPIDIDGLTVFGRLRIATIDQIPAKKKRFWRRSVAEPVVVTVQAPVAPQPADDAQDSERFTGIDFLDKAEAEGEALDMPPVLASSGAESQAQPNEQAQQPDQSQAQPAEQAQQADQPQPQPAEQAQQTEASSV